MKKLKEFLGFYIHCFKNYSNFNGRASRKEFWSFITIDFIIIVATPFLNFSFLAYFWHFLIILYLPYVCAAFIPKLAVSVRRLHDIGYEGEDLVCHKTAEEYSLWAFAPKKPGAVDNISLAVQYGF